MKGKLFSLVLFIASVIAAPVSFAAEKFDVIIVGAGISGIAAGKKLKDHGFSVLILEGRDYVGGRMHTVSLSGIPVDLGASFIEGTTNNPIVALTTQFNIPSKAFNWDTYIIFNTFSKPFQELSNGQYNQIDKLTDALYAQIEKLQDAGLGKNVSLAKGLKSWIASHSALNRLLLRYIIGAEIEHDYGADADTLSLNNFDQDDRIHGGYKIMVKGYQPLVQALMKSSNLDVRLQHKVTAISYNNKGGEVVTSKGRFFGKWVICTVPLGVLKLPAGDPNHINFTPPLPAAKQGAIHRLQMGILDRTILLFPNNFWDKAPWYQHLLIGRVPSSAKNGQWIEAINLAPFLKRPVLSIFNAGSVAANFENKTKEQIVASIMTYLRSVYGENIPQPIGVIVTRWGQDPFSRGAYSHIPPGADGNDYTILGQSVMRLHFAGEATIRSFPSSVRGAYLSGIREADSIIKERNSQDAHNR